MGYAQDMLSMETKLQKPHLGGVDDPFRYHIAVLSICRVMAPLRLVRLEQLSHDYGALRTSVGGDRVYRCPARRSNPKGHEHTVTTCAQRQSSLQELSTTGPEKVAYETKENRFQQRGTWNLI